MLGRRSNLGLAMVLAAMGSGGWGEWQTPVLIGGNPPSRSKRGLRGPGTTAAQIKRASKKARNVRRHKGRA